MKLLVSTEQWVIVHFSSVAFAHLCCFLDASLDFVLWYFHYSFDFNSLFSLLSFDHTPFGVFSPILFRITPTRRFFNRQLSTSFWFTVTLLIYIGSVSETSPVPHRSHPRCLTVHDLWSQRLDLHNVAFVYSDTRASLSTSLITLPCPSLCIAESSFFFLIRLLLDDTLFSIPLPRHQSHHLLNYQNNSSTHKCPPFFASYLEIPYRKPLHHLWFFSAIATSLTSCYMVITNPHPTTLHPFRTRQLTTSYITTTCSLLLDDFFYSTTTHLAYFQQNPHSSPLFLISNLKVLLDLMNVSCFLLSLPSSQ